MWQAIGLLLFYTYSDGTLCARLDLAANKKLLAGYHNEHE